jgi:hypothetical protein
MHLTIDPAELRPLISDVVREVLAAVDWPVDRISLDECEAAQACGTPEPIWSGRAATARRATWR